MFSFFNNHVLVLQVEPGHPFQIPDGGILVIEGIHALNPQYTKTLSDEKVFKIFLSPITQLRVDEANVVKCVVSALVLPVNLVPMPIKRLIDDDHAWFGSSVLRL